MIRKIATLLICTLFVTNDNEKIVSYCDCETFRITNSKIVIANQIQEKEYRFILDFTATKSTISAEFISESLKNNSINKKGQKTSKRITLVSKNKIFSSANKTFEVISQSEKFLDSSLTGIVGFYGSDFFKKTEAILNLDFDKSILCNLNENALKNLITSKNYTEIKSHFSDKFLSVIIIIKKKEYEFVFDTGYAGKFIIPSSKIEFGKEIFENQSIIKNRIFLFNGIYYGSDFAVTSTIGNPRMGLTFIKSFNWIIDYKNKKVFVVKNTISML